MGLLLVNVWLATFSKFNTGYQQVVCLCSASWFSCTLTRMNGSESEWLQSLQSHAGGKEQCIHKEKALKLGDVSFIKHVHGNTATPLLSLWICLISFTFSNLVFYFGETFLLLNFQIFLIWSDLHHLLRK